MKRIWYCLILMAGLLKYYKANAQDECAIPPTCITNSDILNNGTSGDLNYQAPVDGWYVSHGTPTVTGPGAPGSGGVCIWMWSYSGGGEGVFTCYKFNKGKTYTVSLWAMNTNKIDLGNLMIYACKGMQEARMNPTAKQLISMDYTHSDNYVELHYTFTADNDYTQLWIYPLYGGAAGRLQAI